MPNNIQQRYWTNLTELKAQGIYLNAYLIHCESCENWLNRILAITSSSSIAAWAIWRDWSFIWACIIAVSQIINAIKPFLPYSKKIRPLRALVYACDDVFLRAEHNWLYVSNGTFSEEDINKLITDLKKELHVQWVKQMTDISLPENKKLLDLANEHAKDYFKVHYQL